MEVDHQNGKNILLLFKYLIVYEQHLSGSGPVNA